MTRPCGKPAVYRYTWPGRDQACVCDEHAPKLTGIASAMGLHLQLLPADDTDVCSQQVTAEREP